jgi:hypothetical protein
LTPNDVVFGRGKPFQSHEGNLRFHQIVQLHKSRYAKSRRHEKTEIAEEIVQLIKSGQSGEAGRFLKKSQSGDGWVEVEDTIAREKVSHALRGKPKIGADIGETKDPESHAKEILEELMKSENSAAADNDERFEARKRRAILDGNASLAQQAKRSKIEHLKELDFLARQNKNPLILLMGENDGATAILSDLGCAGGCGGGHRSQLVASLFSERQLAHEMLLRSYSHDPQSLVANILFPKLDFQYIPSSPGGVIPCFPP